MLRLERRFDFAAIARGAGIIGDAQLYFVGVVNPNRLLLACDSASGTQVHVYDRSTCKLSLLYQHQGRCKCVGASVDAQENIMAITQEEMRQKDGELRLYFKTSLAEIQPAGESYRLNVRSQLVQNVQFLVSKGGITLFLFVIEGMFIRLYQMHSRKRSGGGVKITAQPLLLSEIVKKFQWYQWDALEEKLYVLTVQGTLRCFSFPKKEKLQFECPLNVPSIPSAYLGFRHFDHCGRAIVNTHLQMSVVKMVDGGLCFCLHHNNVITIYVLHHNLRLTIPCESNTPPIFLRQAPNTLLIWAPGKSVSHISCGLHHTPVISLKTAAPSGDLLRHLIVLPDDFVLDAHMGVVYHTELDRSSLLHCLNNSEPENVTLQTQCVHTALMMMNEDSELVSQIMMHALSKRAGVAASPEFLSEYIVTSVYRKLQQLLPPHLSQLIPLTTLEPLLGQRNVEVMRNYVASVIKGQLYVAEVENATTTPGGSSNGGGGSNNNGGAGVAVTPQILHLGIGNHHTLQQPAPSVTLGFDSPPPSAVASPGAAEPPSAVQRLVSMLFGSSEPDLGPSEEGQGDDGAAQVSVCRVWGVQCEEALCESLFRLVGGRESRTKCIRTAKQIRRAQLETVTQVYKYINDAGAILRDDASLFCIYENLFCALEELSLPLPLGFSQRFVRLGLQCLPPQLFVRYVDNGIFYLTDALIVEMLPAPEVTDPLRVFLIGRIRDASVMMRALRDYPAAAATTVHFYVQQLGIQLPTSQQIELLEEQDDSFFIPLTVFRDHVRRREQVPVHPKDDDIVEYVYHFVCSAVQRQVAAAK